MAFISLLGSRRRAGRRRTLGLRGLRNVLCHGIVVEGHRKGGAINLCRTDRRAARFYGRSSLTCIVGKHAPCRLIYIQTIGKGHGKLAVFFQAIGGKAEGDTQAQGIGRGDGGSRVSIHLHPGTLGATCRLRVYSGFFRYALLQNTVAREGRDAIHQANAADHRHENAQNAHPPLPGAMSLVLQLHGAATGLHVPAQLYVLARLHNRYPSIADARTPL